jgi:hypothetical protein
VRVIKCVTASGRLVLSICYCYTVTRAQEIAGCVVVVIVTPALSHAAKWCPHYLKPTTIIVHAAAHACAPVKDVQVKYCASSRRAYNMRAER